ncbi:hypothetical protein [Deinococcus roseus]|uniref:Uncharacterized protein n=1 Tax=Deinococcus roseus TaxID=392414 RepID=A0ABQ2DAG8_9DEIO|nr:hypothetical protein [Deinococcus roseus]GGJ51186.1 hypothetical protein GCM10008938_41490 [Deinococcus roseus]
MKKIFLFLPLLLVACNRTPRPYDANIIPSTVIFASQQDLYNNDALRRVVVNDRQTITLKIDIPSRINSSNLSQKFSLDYGDKKHIPLKVTHQEYLSATDNQIHTLITLQNTQPLNFAEGESSSEFHLGSVATSDGKKQTLESTFDLDLRMAEVVLQGKNLQLSDAGDAQELWATVVNPTSETVPAFIVRGSCQEEASMATFYQAIEALPAKGSVQVKLKFRNGVKNLSSTADCNIWGSRSGDAIAIE